MLAAVVVVVVVAAVAIFAQTETVVAVVAVQHVGTTVGSVLWPEYSQTQNFLPVLKRFVHETLQLAVRKLTIPVSDSTED